MDRLADNLIVFLYTNVQGPSSSIDGSVVEFSPATLEGPVQFPVNSLIGKYLRQFHLIAHTINN